MQVRDAREAVPLKMRVIVGKATNRTPIFSDTVTEVVFSPYWNIPQSIEVKEMLPSIMKDSDFLQKKDIEVVRSVNGQPQVVDPSTIDWANAADAGDFQLRQRPGADNALGFVKFIFPNRHNVYLHDTPNDNLFDKLTRDLSHGCVRLEEPVKLASYVLRDQSEWTPEGIEAAMHAGKERHVALKNPVQVHLVYLTVRVDEDGVPQFFEDVYGYDLRQQALLRPASPLPQTAGN
jgi:murein L,D-transpeptidase YcbB/YkuD